MTPVTGRTSRYFYAVGTRADDIDRVVPQDQIRAYVHSPSVHEEIGRLVALAPANGWIKGQVGEKAQVLDTVWFATVDKAGWTSVRDPAAAFGAR